MILSKRPEIDRFLKAPDPAIRAAVIHGKDRSGVAERADEQVLQRLAVLREVAEAFDVAGRDRREPFDRCGLALLGPFLPLPRQRFQG